MAIIVSCSAPNISDLPAFLYKVISKEHALIIKEFSDRATEGKNQTLVGVIPFCGEYPGPRFDDKFRSANQIDGISIAGGGKMADS